MEFFCFNILKFIFSSVTNANCILKMEILLLADDGGHGIQCQAYFA